MYALAEVLAQWDSRSFEEMIEQQKLSTVIKVIECGGPSENVVKALAELGFSAYEVERSSELEVWRVVETIMHDDNTEQRDFNVPPLPFESRCVECGKTFGTCDCDYPF